MQIKNNINRRSFYGKNKINHFYFLIYLSSYLFYKNNDIVNDIFININIKFSIINILVS